MDNNNNISSSNLDANFRHNSPWHAVMKRDSSSSSGAGVAPQTCGTDNINFYCPYDSIDRCKPRNQRCTESNICNNPNTMMEDDCSEAFNPGQYNVLLGHADLSDSGKNALSLNIDLLHFVDLPMSLEDPMVSKFLILLIQYINIEMGWD
jgi:hypothetical protein